MTRHCAWRNRRGFTLIECIAAVLILGVGLVGVAGSMTAALLSNQKASDMQLAISIAQSTIEEMRSQGFGSVTYDDFPATATQTTEPELADLHAGTRTIVITNNYGGNTRLKKVAVTVSWRGRNATPVSITLETIVTNRTGDTST